jgi:hypothetical protein
MPELQVGYALATVSLARWTPIFTVRVPARLAVDFRFGA